MKLVEGLATKMHSFLSYENYDNKFYKFYAIEFRHVYDLCGIYLIFLQF